MHITETFEPIRPIYAKDDGRAFALRGMIDHHWRAHYGLSTWASRSYLLIRDLHDWETD